MNPEMTGQRPIRKGGRAGIAFGLTLVLVLGVGGFWFLHLEPFHVPSVAMVPELVKDQRVLVHKRGPGARVHRGDVVAYSRPGASAGSPPQFVGRVVAEAGEVIEVQARRLKLNGATVERVPCTPPQFTTVVQPPGAAFPTRIFSQCELETLPAGPTYRVLFEESAGRIRGSTAALKVPEGTVYVLGDNRDQAEDSRQQGPIPLGSLLGRVTRMPFSK